ncbi:MAG: InlB B-repeat-containing protein [Roseburia sp.]|nr:InlB B-repeat-containing protein [Roseburia sp.]
MKNKTKNVKWTKKLKAIVISISLAFAVALGGAFTAVGLSLSNKNGKLSGAPAGSVADEISVDVPINESMRFEISSADQWAEVVAKESSATGYALATLTKDITATSGSFGTGTEETDPYYNGAFNVPAGKYIVIDLNGHNIDRKLTAGQADGLIIQNLGELVVRDTSNGETKGTLTGAYNNGGMYFGDPSADYGIGGAIRSYGNLTLANINITGNKATYGGAVYMVNKYTELDEESGTRTEIVNTKTLNILNCNLSDNSATNYAGAVCASAGTIINISGSKLNNNLAENGGGVAVNMDNCTLSAENTEFIGNSAPKSGGGAIRLVTQANSIREDTLTLKGCTFKNNTATEGGAIYTRVTTTIEDTVFENNTATTGSGGAIYYVGSNRYDTSVIVKSGRIANNYAVVSGGGIFCYTIQTYRPSLILGDEETGEYPTITGNEARANYNSMDVGGGGVYVGSQVKLTVYNANISKNKSTRGGGIYISGAGEADKMEEAAAVIKNITVDGNESTFSGGIYTRSNYAKLTIEKGVISNNYTTDDAAGLLVNNSNEVVLGTENGKKGDVKFISNTSLTYGSALGINANSKTTMYGVEFTGNSAGTTGGAMNIDNATVTATNCSFENNSAFANGGALNITGASTVTLTGCTFTGNTTKGDGGAIRVVDTSEVTLKSVTITGGDAGNNGGGIYAGSRVNLTDVSITENNALNNGGGLYKASTVWFIQDGSLVNITITDNTQANTRANNLYFAKDSGGLSANGGDPASVGISAATGTGDLTFLGGVAGRRAYSNDGSKEGFYPDDSDNYQIVEAVGATSYSYTLRSKMSGTNAALWKAAVDKSMSTGKPVLFKMVSDWDLQTDSAVTSNAEDDYFAYKRLKLGHDTSIILDLNGYTLKRTVSRSNTGMLFKVNGNLTIIGDGTVTAGNNTGNGGVFIIQNGATVTINGGNFTGNYAAKGGIATVTALSTLIINGGKFYSNTAGTCGGAFHVDGTSGSSRGGTLIINGGEIYSNSTPQGGAIYAENGATVQINGGKIYNHTTTNGSGGGIFMVKGSTLSIGSYDSATKTYSGDAQIYNNTATGSSTANDTSYMGGGIYAPGGLTLYSGVIRNNTAKGPGGGIYTSGTFNMYGGEIYKNVSQRIDTDKSNTSKGADVYVSGATFNMSGGEIRVTPNETNRQSGVYVPAGATFNFSGGKITSAAAGTTDAAKITAMGICGAGGTINMSSTAELTGFKNSQTSAIQAYGGTLSITGGKIYNNSVTTTSCGGAIWLKQDITVTISGGEFYNNTANAYGGFMYAEGENINIAISDGEFYKNKGSNGGVICLGGVRTTDTATSSLTVTGGTFYNNKATSAGGVFRAAGVTTISIAGGDIYGNSANYGGAIYGASSTVKITDGLLHDNKAVYAGGAIDGAASTTRIELTGGEIYNNTANNGGGISLGGSGLDGAWGKLIVDGDIKIHNNKALASNLGGGAIYVAGGASLELKGGEIYENEGAYGGAINLSRASTTENGVDRMKYPEIIMTGGKIYKNSAIYGGGGIYGNQPTANSAISGGSIYENTASVGGGIYINSLNNDLRLTNVEITDNVAGEYGGGLCVANGSASSIILGNDDKTGGVNILRNHAVRGGGIRAATNLIINAGSISHNVADMTAEPEKNSDGNHGGHGGGIYGNTITMNGGLLSENTCYGNGGAIAGILTMNGGEISNNHAVLSDAYTNKELAGLGAALSMTGSAVISGGKIIDNDAARFAGAIYIQNGLTLTVTGGDIVGNTAGELGGATYAMSAANYAIGGTANISGNTADGNPNNIYLTQNAVLTVSGISSLALDGEFTVGITIENDERRVFTSGLASMAQANRDAAIKNYFKADKDDVIVGLDSSNEATLMECARLTIEIVDQKGDPTGQKFVVKSDTDQPITFVKAADNKSYTFTSRQGGYTGITTKVNVPVIPGYTPYLYNHLDNNSVVANGDSVLTMDGDKTLRIGYKPNEDTAYKIYYILQQVSGEGLDENGYTTVTDPTTLSGMTSTVKVFSGAGTTDTVIVPMTGDGKPFTEWSESQHFLFDKMVEPDATIKGDGTGYALVYLKLKEYTVKFSASGALTNAVQNIKFKYGETLKMADGQVVDGTGKALTKAPSKDMNRFEGWYLDSACTDGQELKAGYKVVGDVTVYAKFSTQHYKLIFDLNIGSGANQINLEYALSVADEYRDYNLENTGNRIAWNTAGLFPTPEDLSLDFGFEALSDMGRFVIDYTVNNVRSTKNITEIVPSSVGYTFLGWYAAGASDATEVIRRPNASNTNTTVETALVLTARWSPASYTVRFDTNDPTTNRVISRTATNGRTWDSIKPTTAITRDGYLFDYWYMETDDGNKRLENIGAATDANGNAVFAISEVAEASSKFLTPTGYNFSDIRVYAKWKSVDIWLRYPSDGDGNIISMPATIELVNGKGASIEITDTQSTPASQIDDRITVTVTPELGYRFVSLRVNRRTITSGISTVGGVSTLTFTITGNDVVTEYGEDDELHYYVELEPTFAEQNYSITYDRNGGKSAVQDEQYNLTYTMSQILTGSMNPVRLPSKLIRRGYKFMGWELNEQEVFETSDTAHPEKGLYGAELFLNITRSQIGNLKLTAKWEALESNIYLYNAVYESHYTKPTGKEYHLLNTEILGTPIKTDVEYEIINPNRGESFVFLGWATSKGGSVVYPAVKGKGSITYTIKADKDENGNALNLNNLYAVWQVAGVNYIIMSAENNGCVYGENTISMSAKPARDYESDQLGDIKLTYEWYKIYDYENCFKQVPYIDDDGFAMYLNDSDETVAYEKDGIIYGVKELESGAHEPDLNNVLTAVPAGATKLTYKEFIAAEALSRGYCALKSFPESEGEKDPGDTIQVTVKDVNDCGIYVCVVSVVETGGNTKADGYGEIEIAMNKAEYRGLTFADRSVTYNTETRSAIAREMLTCGAGASISNTSGGSYLTLPDGSRLVITYKYYKGEGELRQEITDLSKIRDVGTYHIVASFAYTPDGNKGNYLDIEEIEADLVITADPISHIEYAFRHGEEIKATDVTKFTGAYDGAAYAVEATIEDETGTATPVKVTSVDDLALDIKVYRVSEDGSATEVTGATTESGKYYIEIVGLKGDAAGNYVLGTGITVKVEYTIGKVAYEVAEHIAFKGKSVDFNNEIQTISIELDEGYEIPADIEVKYTTTYEPEEEGYTGALQNIADEGNGGRYAGVYTVTVTFEFRNEAAANNYAEIESKSATLTIEKADFFGYYNQEGVDLLRDAGFVNAINAYTVGTWYDPYISSGILTNAENFALTYEYYKVAEDGTRDILASGSHAELVANSAAAVSANTLNSIIMRAGKYEVVANIRYVSAQYKNNFKEIPESERTITYVIEEVDVESVTVTWKEDFDKVVSLGAGFDYSWIKSITVEYKAAEDGTGGGTDTITTGTEIALAGIRLEGKGNNVEQTTFWKVGDFKVWLSYYGVESAAETLKVKENISAVQVEYSVDGGSSYRDVTEEGIELVESETYLFKVRFTGTDENGVSGTLEREAELKGAIKLGEENELSVKDAEEYKFGEIKVSTYKVVSAEVIWQYKIGNGAWKNMPETHEIEYAGGEIKIQAVFEDGGKQTLEAHAGEGVEIRNVSDYVVTVGRRGNYKLEDEYGFNVVPLKLEVTWDKDELTYNTYHQTPKVKTHNRAESDAETLVFEYEYTDRNGAMLTQAHVIDVGEYVVKLVLTGSARNNYTLAGSESATHEFRITQAEIEAKVTYNEHTYGENKTYAGNGSLRLKAMKADFGDKAVIEGTFAFITNYNEATGKYDVADESATKAMIANRNEALKVWYVYTPTGENDKKNYKDKVGYIEIDVQNQTARTGKGALSVEFGENSVQFYLVNQEFETAGIEVYLLYQSSYQEDEVWYGYRSKVENPTFRIGTFKADGYKITPQDLSSEKVVLNAISGSNSGTLDVSVVDKVATGLEVSSTTHRTTYYVNEAFDYSDMEFRVTFGDGNSQDGLRKGSVKTASPVVFDTEGKYTVTFTYFNVSCDVEFTVAPKQDLTIIEPSNLVLTYRNGEKLDAPQLKAVVDGITYNQSEFAEKLKISVRVEVTNKANNQTAELGALEEGVYNVRYIFTSNNPRFNTPQTKNLEVRVTTNPYELDITLPESGLSKVYTGEYIEIPKYVLNSVTDKQTETMVPNSRISVIATINGEEVTKESDWSRTALEVGAYEVVIVVKVTGSDGKEFDPVSYTLQVTKSANDGVEAKLNVKPVIYTAGVEFGFTVEAEFGADKVVYTYSKTRNGDYKTFAEVGEFSAGTWYVKATIADTKNYAGIELIEPFEVRVSGIGSDEGSIEGSITGTDGIGEGWKLTITENETEEVVIERQEVLYGYNVKLTDANNQAVELSGEYTVVITLTEEQAEALNGKSGLKMFMYDAEGKATELKEADVTVEGNKLTFKTDRFGDFALTEAIPAAAGVPIGLIVGLIVGGVAAAGMIAACVVVFLKKKRGAQQ